MFRHVVILGWKDGTTAEQRATVVARLRTLPSKISAIRSYVVGENAGVDPDTADLAIVADFDDVAGYVTYRDHPDHQTVIREVIAPIISTRMAIQHNVSD